MAAVREYAVRYPQYGYRMITALLQQAGYGVNHKHIERIWRQEGHYSSPPEKSTKVVMAKAGM